MEGKVSVLVIELVDGTCVCLNLDHIIGFSPSRDGNTTMILTSVGKMLEASAPLEKFVPNYKTQIIKGVSTVEQTTPTPTVHQG